MYLLVRLPGFRVFVAVEEVAVHVDADGHGVTLPYHLLHPRQVLRAAIITSNSLNTDPEITDLPWEISQIIFGSWEINEPGA